MRRSLLVPAFLVAIWFGAVRAEAGDGEEGALDEVRRLQPPDRPVAQTSAGPDRFDKIELPPAVRAFLEVADRFVETYPRSSYRGKVEWQAARALYDYNHFAAAFARFERIALAADPDPELCAHAKALAVDCLAVQREFKALSAWLSRFDDSACGLRLRPKRMPTKPPAAPVDPDPALDALEFFAGCWSYYSVDAGYRVCWHRRGAEWLGHTETVGPMARPSWAGMAILRTKQGLVLVDADDSKPKRLMKADADRVVFGSGATRLEIVRDKNTGELLITRGGSTHRFKSVAVD